MQFFLTRSLWIPTPRRMAIALSALLLVMAVGCPMTEPGDNGDGTNGTDALDQVAGEIVGLRNNLIASELETSLAIFYSITGVPPAAVLSAFFVTVPDPGTSVSPQDSRVFFTTNLPAGESLAFVFSPNNAGTGFHRLGLRVMLGEESVEIISAGVVVVEGGPDPRFVLPPDAITVVTAGDPVPVTFDAGDPQNEVSWRLFLLSPTDRRDNPADVLGEELDTGFGNIGQFSLSTIGRPAGRYELGLSATDSGLSIAATVADGKSDLIVTTIDKVIDVVELVDVAAPTLAFTAPGLTDVNLFGTQEFTIRFEASADPAGGIVEIDIFVDDDCDPSNGKTRLNNEPLPVTATTIALPTDLDEGTYCVIGEVRQATRLVEVTATGRIIIARSPTLTVLAPDTVLPIGPTDTIEIRWTTNVPEGFGLIDVFARTLDAGGTPFGSEIPITEEPQPTTVTSASFTRTQSGVYQINVRLTLSDPNVTSDDCPDGLCVKSSPRPVRVSSVPPIVWVGELAKAVPAFEGAIFEGVNFEDNAGTSFSAVNDLNGDGAGEFLISARYGKPFFQNPTGVGVGEAYLIYGGVGAAKLTGVFNLNSVGTPLLRGVTFTGIRTPQASNETDGMSSVSRLPDVDNDGRDELVFGFPRTDSRGHNISPAQDGVADPRSLGTLEREQQFLRGGVVIVGSRNSILSDPRIGEPVINLDLVGQDFRVFGGGFSEFCVQEDADQSLPDDVGDFAVDAFGAIETDPGDTNFPGCAGSCDDRTNGGAFDATEYIDFGFVAALARDYFSTYVYSFDFYGGVDFCTDITEPFRGSACLFNGVRVFEYCIGFVSACEPFSPGLHAVATDPDGPFDEFGLPLATRLSGFYPQFVPNPDDQNFPFTVNPFEPLGARIIGVGFDDEFGTSITLTNATGLGAGDIIVSSPGRTARGIAIGAGTCNDPPSCGGEIDGMGTSVNSKSGVAYMFSLRSLWTQDSFGRAPPRPHQYIVGEGSHCSVGGGYTGLIDNIDATRIAGFAGDQITNIVGIDDFNNDGLNDFAVGAPNANNDRGRVYVAFRRGPGLEGDFVLDKLALSANDPERLTGALIVTDTLDGLGSSLATGVDFNRDGISDLVIGSPNANGGTGEVIVVFGDPNLRTPENGITVNELLSTRRADGSPRAARITGNGLDLSGHFGFNVANAGDVDGDGLNDLLIAAPGATPRFDPDPTDDDDTLTAPGIDANFDGCPDDVSGPLGSPNFNDECTESDPFDALQGAGLVYVIFGSNRLDQLTTCSGTENVCEVDSDCADDEFCGLLDFSVNINQLGKSQLRGFMIAGRRGGDRAGGGDAGSVSEGGIEVKKGRGRSKGLASAGDVDGDGRADILVGAVLADPRVDPNSGFGVQNSGEAYLIYGSVIPAVSP